MLRFMLTLSQLSKAYGGQTLLESTSLLVQPGERLALVGPNGAGKSTLFAMVLGTVEPDGGTITLQRGTTVGHLPQESAPAGEETVLELAAAISPDLQAAYASLRRHADPGDGEHHNAVARLTELEAHHHEARAKRILAGLAFREEDFLRPARTLSGGWIMRAHLARLLVMEPDLLMLDEPTNHLDLETLIWLQQHLSGYRGALLLISHDRAFINALCNGIVALEHQRLVRYQGNYNAYLVQRAERRAQHKAAYENQQREIAHIQSFIDRFRAKASKAAQAQSRLKQLEKMELIPPPEDDAATIHFRFPQPPKSGLKVAELTHVRQAYGEHVVYSDLNLTIERGQKIVLVGPNGAGKSTLLKILAGLVPLEAGSCELGHQVRAGYFSQQRTEQLDLNAKVIDEAGRGSHGVTYQATRDLLGAFLFSGDSVDKKVNVLSGGEKSRLALVRLLLNPPNLVLLDEPTTHLDMASIDALIQALRQYAGTLIFVSHDVHFIRAVATQVIHVQAGRLTAYAGDYDYYLLKSAASGEREGLVAGLSDHRPGQSAVASKPTPSSASSTPGISPKERRREAAEQRQRVAALQKKAEALEETIIDLETQLAALSSELENPEYYTQPDKIRSLRQQIDRLNRDLVAKNQAWEALAEQIGSLTSV